MAKGKGKRVVPQELDLERTRRRAEIEPSDDDEDDGDEDAAYLARIRRRADIEPSDEDEEDEDDDMDMAAGADEDEYMERIRRTPSPSDAPQVGRAGSVDAVSPCGFGERNRREDGDDNRRPTSRSTCRSGTRAAPSR